MLCYDNRDDVGFFYDNRDNGDNGLIVNSMLSVDNNKNNFYQPKGWLPLETC